MDFVNVVDPFIVKVDGSEVEVDQRSFTLAERRRSRSALLGMSNDDELAPDEADAVAALVWTVLRRSDPELTLEAVCESMTVGDLAGARVVPAEELEDRDDDPEA